MHSLVSDFSQDRQDYPVKVPTMTGSCGMKQDNKLKISKEKRVEMVTLIKNYFLTERDEAIGDLAAGMLLDFIVEKMAPEFYNQGIDDAYKFMQDRLEDLLAIEKR